jgi:hypothetical protein
MTLAPNLTALPLDDFQADLPIEQNQFSINGESRSGLSRADSLLDFSKQFSYSTFEIADSIRRRPAFRNSLPLGEHGSQLPPCWSEDERQGKVSTKLHLGLGLLPIWMFLRLLYEGWMPVRFSDEQ